MALYNPGNRPENGPCDETPGSCPAPGCGPIPGNDLPCCPTSFPQRRVCPVEVYVPGCEPGYDQPLDGRVNCDCIPCLDDLAFTDEQKTAVQQILEGLLKNISPYAFACCQIVDPQGHMYPLTRRRLHDESTGEPLFKFIGDPAANPTIDVNSYFTQTEIDAMIADAALTVTQADFERAFEECCDIPAYSAFVNYGLAPFGAMGITGGGR